MSGRPRAYSLTMARIEDATITPTKIELVTTWLPTQPWFSGDHEAATIVGSYRFDDPEGEVGVEVLLVRTPGADAATWQVPLSYRAAPLADGEEFFITTMEHSVLGPRWIYNAIGDPVYRTELARVIAQADTNVPEFVNGPQGLVERPRKTLVQGSGIAEQAVPEFFAASVIDASDVDGAAVVDTGLARLIVTRKVGGRALATALSGGAQGHLSGHWPGQEAPQPLAALTVGVRG